MERLRLYAIVLFTMSIMLFSVLIMTISFASIDNDIMVEATKAAHPVFAPYPYSDEIMGSSSQIKFYNKRFTLTNLHICVQYIEKNEEMTRAEIIKAIQDKSDFTINPRSSLMIGNTRVKVLAISEEHDLCLLEPIKGSSYFELSMFTPKLHDEIFIIGHPRGLPQTIREGRILTTDMKLFIPWIMTPQTVNVQMISAISYGGNSGSPVLNKSGFLIGVLFAGPLHFHTEALIVPLKEVRQFLRRVVMGGNNG